MNDTSCLYIPNFELLISHFINAGGLLKGLRFLAIRESKHL